MALISFSSAWYSTLVLTPWSWPSYFFF